MFKKLGNKKHRMKMLKVKYAQVYITRINMKRAKLYEPSEMETYSNYDTR